MPRWKWHASEHRHELFNRDRDGRYERLTPQDRALAQQVAEYRQAVARILDAARRAR